MWMRLSPVDEPEEGNTGTVQASTGGEVAAHLPGISFPGRSRVASWTGDRRRKRTWRFANHAAMAAVLIVALVKGYFGFQGGNPNGRSGESTNAILADPAGTPYAVTDAECTTNPTTAEEIDGIVTARVELEASSDITVLPEAPDAATIESVQQTQQQLIACSMEPLRYYALLSDNCLRTQVWTREEDPKAELKPGMVATAIAEEVARMDEKQATVNEVAATPPPGSANTVVLDPVGAYEVIYPDDVELLSDGRAGAILRWISTGGETTALIPQNPTYRFFVNVDGQWLFDCDAPVSQG